MADTIGIIYGAPRLRGCASARAGPRGTLHERLPGGATSARGGGGMTGEKGACSPPGLRAEAPSRATRHRFAWPCSWRCRCRCSARCLPGRADLQRVELLVRALPTRGSLLVVACVAQADARTRMRGLLGLGFLRGAPGGPRRSGASRSARSRTSWSSASTSRDRRSPRRASRSRARSRCSSARSSTR